MQSIVCDTEWSLWTISTPIVTIQVGCVEENRLSGFQPFDAQRVTVGGERATQQPMKEESQQNLFQYKLNLDIVVGESSQTLYLVVANRNPQECQSPLRQI